ncbi:hypothetical protein BDR04DRAFT_1160269, partial [Suillus decipiens]
EHADLLPDGHWVWADSAYPLEPWCIAPFKKPHNGQLTKHQKSFNYHLSKICVHVEHTFSVLKGQFQSLRELQFRIKDEKDLEFAVQWIKYCIILHNMIICFEIERCKKDGTYKSSLKWARKEGEEFIVQETEGPDGEEVVGDRTYEGTPGQAAHIRLMDALFDSPHSDAQHREG